MKGLAVDMVHEIDVMEGLRSLKSESAQMIIVDPPYNIGKDFGNNSDKMDMESYFSWCDEWIGECLRVLKSDGTMFIYGFSEILAGISVRIPCSKRWLIWHYTNKNSPNLNFWQRSHESIIACWKDGKYFNRDAVREPYTSSFLKNAAGKQRKNTPGRFSNNTDETTTYTAHEGGALPRDVIKVPALAGGAGKSERIKEHPTQKPLALCEILIKSCKQNETDLVVVPFAGSGSECFASKKLNIPFIGFEINPEYVSICNKRCGDEVVVDQHCASSSG